MKKAISMLLALMMLLSVMPVYADEAAEAEPVAVQAETVAEPEKEEAKAETPKAEEPAAEEPAAEEPAAEEPAAEPAAEESAEEPVAEQPATEAPAEEPAAEEPATEEPTEEPAAEESTEETAEEPAAEEGAELPEAEAEEACAHALVYVEEIPATCTEDGVAACWRCDLCEKLYLDETAETEVEAEQLILPALGHELTYIDVSADAPEDGAQGLWYCERCGNYYTDEAATTLYTEEEETVTEQATYTGTCGDNLTWVYDSTAGTLTISGTGAMEDYSSSYDVPWRSYYSSGLWTVVVEEGVTSIGGYAFYNSAVENISLPDSLERIGAYALSGLVLKSSLNLSANLTSFGSNALSQITIDSIEIPYGWTTIPDGLFYACNMKSVTIPDSVESIGSDAFNWCTKLTGALRLPNVTSIGNRAFLGCSGITSIVAEDCLLVGEEAFEQCTNLSSFLFAGTAILCDKAFMRTGITSVSISGGSVGKETFYECASLESVALGNNVNYIGEEAFYNCSSLSSVTIGTGITEIPRSAFSCCGALTTITIPGNVKTIGEDAFYGSGLTEVTLGDGVQEIDMRAFTGCSSLTTVNHTDSVVKVYPGAFEGTQYTGDLLNVGWQEDEPEEEPLYTVTLVRPGDLGNLELPIYESYFEWSSKYYLPADFSEDPNGMWPGYCILGWYKDRTLKKQVTYVTRTTGNIKLYPKYGFVGYSIDFHLNGGTQNKWNIRFYTIEGSTLFDPTRKGYKFTGWYRDEGLTVRWESIPANLHEDQLALYAGWKIIDYAITYNLNAGSDAVVNPNPASYTVDDDAITLAAPTRTGYTFKGWYTDKKLTKKATAIKAGSTGSKTFYAKWEVTKYPVTYILNGGTQNKKNVATYTINKGANLYEPTRKGYTFKGWWLMVDGDPVERWGALQTGMTGEVTLSAEWEITVYSITYELGEGAEGYSTNPNTTVSYTVASDLITLEAPERAGAAFKGWYSDAKYTKKVTSIPTGSTGNKTFYAKWEFTKYPVTYELSAGFTQNKKNPSTYTYLGTTLYPATRKGYTFVGWYNLDSGGDVFNSIPANYINDGMPLRLGMIAYATDYTITYNLNGGENAAENPASYTIEDATITLAAPTREGYTFKGWYSDKKLTKKVTAVKSGSTGNKTLYAKWAANTYKVIFDGNGATGGTMKALSCTYGKAATLTANAFKCTGCTFAGWNTMPDGSGASFANKASVKSLVSEANGTITLYAQWK